MTKTVEQDDGTYVTTVASSPLHYEDSAGQWQVIDTSLIASDAAGFAWENAANAFETRFREELLGNYLDIEASGRTASLSLVGALPTTGSLLDGVITYPSALANVDLEYAPHASGVKETLVLHNRLAPPSFHFLLAPPAGGLRPEELGDGSWALWADDLDDPLFVLTAPYAEDANGAVADAQAGNASMDITEVAGTLAIDLEVDPLWLADPARAFPVRLDPTVVIGPASTNLSFRSSCASCAPTAGGRRNVGGNSTTHWVQALKFGIGQIPAGASITSAELGIFFDRVCITTGCGGPHLLNVHRMTSDWSYSSSTYGSLTWASTALAGFTLPAPAAGEDAPAAQWMTWNVTNTVKDWFLGNQPNYGFIIRHSPASGNTNGPSTQGNTSTDPSIEPRLTVVWSGNGVVVNEPRLLHATGAALSWTRYAGTNFTGYEIHRSATANFSPSAATRLTTIRAQNATTFTDTTARAGGTFSYAVVVDSSASNQRRVTLPAAGTATVTLQPDATDGKVARIENIGSTCENFGAQDRVNIGTTSSGKRRGLFEFDLRDIPSSATVSAATFSYYYEPSSASVGQVNVHRVTRAWREGGSSGNCTGGGASWQDAYGSSAWTAAGGDYAATASATKTTADRTGGGWDSFTVTSLVNNWVTNAEVDHGLLVRLNSETLTAGNQFVIYTDDFDMAPTLRPKLEVTYTETLPDATPRVSISKPAPGAQVSGAAVTVGAVAHDDGVIASVEFFADGALISTDNSAPYEITWNTGTINGTRTLTARAIDDAGNQSTSAGVAVTVYNRAAPAVTTPTLSQTGNISGTATITTTATAAGGVNRVEFFFDDYLIGTDTSATNPNQYSANWDTLDPLLPAYDGSHAVTARVYDAGGQVTSSAVRTVTVANRPSGGMFSASFAWPSGQQPPSFMYEDRLAGGRTADPTKGSSGGGSIVRALKDDPYNSVPGGGSSTDGACSTDDPNETDSDGYSATVTVTNTSSVTWTAQDDLRVWYRWYRPVESTVNGQPVRGEVIFEGEAADVPGSLQPSASKNINLTIMPPKLCGETQLADYQVRIDLFRPDTDGAGPITAAWFSEMGNPPVEQPVRLGKKLAVDRALSTALGLERYYHYWAEDVGAGMTQLVNVVNGNTLLTWSPWAEPGRGLSSVLSLTYNSLEDRSRSPVGNNWSLNTSGLTRFGEPLDLHAINGQGNKWIELTDGDGTTHRFEGKSAGQTTYWEEPPGVHLYLRAYTGADAGPARTWAITRPDRVTFFFDADGYPTFVRDRNGNELQFVLQNTPSGEDPGGPAKRIVEVRDNVRSGSAAADSKSFTIAYYSKTEAKKPQVRGNIKSITDHNGSALRFDYYDDGNLLRITQAGGANADGSFLPDRSWVFTYTSSSGDVPAIGTASARLSPDPKTTNQSTRIYSIRDPRSQGDAAKPETVLAYCGSTACGPGSSAKRWKLKSRDDRAGKTTSIAYDVVAQSTTITAPGSNRVSTFSYDDDGKVTDIVDPAGRHTLLTWSADFAVTELDEPGAGLQQFTYNDNGYLTSRKVKFAGTDTSPQWLETQLDYQNLAADADDTQVNDTSGHWRTGRTIPHVSQLIKKTDPNGVATGGNANDFRWLFDYDSRGNLRHVTDPENFVTTYDYDATSGLLTQRTDARGDITLYELHDRNGLPTRVKEGLTSPTGTPLRITTLNFDNDGNLIWLQDGRHQSPPAGAATRSYRTYFEYDEFGRLGRQSTPKSTELAEGVLIWTNLDYDANDNPTRNVGPHYGYGDGKAGAVTTTTYDPVDRPTLITGPDQSDDPAGERVALTYDDAGRLTSQVRPEGLQSTLAGDYTTTFDYDALDRVLRQTVKDLSTTGAVLETRTTHSCYDTEGNLASVTGPRASVTTVDCASPPPFTTRYTYDAAHRRLSVTDPEDRTTQTGYDLNGNVATTTNALTKVTRLFYDQRNLLTRAEEPFGDPAHPAPVTSLFEYDPVGNRSRQISPRGSDAGSGGIYTDYVTSYTYDALDRLIRTKLPDDPGSASEQAYQHTLYDANDNPLWTSLPVTTSDPNAVNPDEKTVVTYFDPGWIESSDNPDPQPATHFDYTAEGWQRLRTPERAGQPERQDTSLQVVWEYYPDGMLRAVHDRSGQRATYRYDADNALVEAIDRSGVVKTGLAQTPDQGPIYNVVSASYNDFDEPTHVEQRFSDSTTRYTDFYYYKDGSVFQRRDNGRTGTTVNPVIHTLTYDDAGWLETDTDDGGTVTSNGDDRKIVNSYFPAGWLQSREIQRKNASGLFEPRQTTTRTYFDNGDVKSLITVNGAGTEIENHAISYLEAGTNRYLNGHRTKDVFTRKGPSSSCNATACPAAYTYDARDRLINENNGHGGINTYDLDVAGNVRLQTVAGITTTNAYVGTQLQQSTRAGVTTKYWYTATGALNCITTSLATDDNPCKQVSTGPGNANLVTDYTYDYLDRLEGTRTFNASGTLTEGADYWYDALDRVVSETQLHPDTGNRTEGFGYLGLTNLLTSETQTPASGAATTKTYGYDAFGQRMTMSSKTGTANIKWYAYGSDPHGSTSTLLEISDGVSNTELPKATYGYTAYGSADDELTAGDYDPSDPAEAATDGLPLSNNNDPANAYRYTGKRLDAGAGDSLDMGARRFSPDVARFLQVDYFNGALADVSLSSDPLTSNRYALAGGNPLSFIEWDGHMPIPVADMSGIGPLPPTAHDEGTGTDDGGTTYVVEQPVPTAAPAPCPMGQVCHDETPTVVIRTQPDWLATTICTSVPTPWMPACALQDAEWEAHEGDAVGVGLALSSFIPFSKVAKAGGRFLKWVFRGGKAEESLATIVRFADRAAARGALSGAENAAANRFFRDAGNKGTDFFLKPLSGKRTLLGYFSPARNLGYGKAYRQVIDAEGAVLQEWRMTLDPAMNILSITIQHGSVEDIRWLLGATQ
jgi:RHS repeat-associated protein